MSDFPFFSSFRLHNLDEKTKEIRSKTGQLLGYFKKPYTTWAFLPKDGLFLELEVLSDLVTALQHLEGLET